MDPRMKALADAMAANAKPLTSVQEMVIAMQEQERIRQELEEMNKPVLDAAEQLGEQLRTAYFVGVMTAFEAITLALLFHCEVGEMK